MVLRSGHCSPSVISVYPEGGGSARDTRVSLTSVDMVSRLAMNKIEIGIRLLNRITWLCFLVFVDIKTG